MENSTIIIFNELDKVEALITAVKSIIKSKDETIAILKDTIKVKDEYIKTLKDGQTITIRNSGRSKKRNTGVT